MSGRSALIAALVAAVLWPFGLWLLHWPASKRDFGILGLGVYGVSGWPVVIIVAALMAPWLRGPWWVAVLCALGSVVAGLIVVAVLVT